jgi:hypothetical protein
MSRFGKKQEDQLAYKVEKLEKQIRMLLEHIKNVERSNDIYHTFVVSILQKVGGTIDLIDDYESKRVEIDFLRNEDIKTTTVFLKEMVEKNIEDLSEDNHV